NLIAELAKEDPARLERMRADAAATPNGEGLLWRIDAEGSATSFLFGTMHVTDPRVVKLPPPAAAAFAEAQTLVIETTEVMDRRAMMAALARQPELMMFPAGESLTDHLTPEERDVVKRALAERGVPLQSVVKMKPWMLVSLVSLPECELQRQETGAKVLDAQLAADAKGADKTIAGLETVGEQFSAMASLPMDLHIQGLVATLSLGEKTDDMIETMIALYLDGETGMFQPALSTLLQHGREEAADYATFQEKMVDMRNETMVRRAAPFLEAGGAFIAVGAMHLPGEAGLIELLRKAGYRVSRAD